jgi:hypothetical protein
MDSILCVAVVGGDSVQRILQALHADRRLKSARSRNSEAAASD